MKKIINLIGISFSAAILFSCSSKSNSEYLESVELIEVATLNDYESYELPNSILEDSSSIKTINKDFSMCAAYEERMLGTMNSGSKKFVYVLDRNNQGTGSLFGLGKIDLSKKEKIAIVDYVQYFDTICTPGSGQQTHMTTRLAVGVRLYLKINKANKKVSVNIPSKVAAAAEFGLAEATFTIETIGFATNETRDILSGLGENFNVESYVKIMGAVGSVMDVMNDSMMVRPVVIPINNK